MCMLFKYAIVLTQAEILFHKFLQHYYYSDSSTFYHPFSRADTAIKWGLTVIPLYIHVEQTVLNPYIVSERLFY